MGAPVLDLPEAEGLIFSIENSIEWVAANEEKIVDLSIRSRWPNPYFSPQWLRLWWERLEGHKTPVLLVVTDHYGKLVGFWPFVERPGVLYSKGLWPFIFDEANYFHPLAETCCIPVLVQGLQSLLQKYIFVWIPLMRNLFWKNFLEPKIENQKQPYIARAPRSTSMVNVDSGEFDEFWSKKLGTKSQKSFRYDQGALAKQGDVKFEFWEKFEDVRAMMPSTCLVEVESKKSKDGAGLFSVRGKRGFFFELFPELAKLGQIRLSFLRLNDEPIAWQINLLDKDYLAVHHLSYNEKWKKFSPGRQLLHANMKLAWDEQRVIDFLPLTFAYKEKLATENEKVNELHWFKRSLRGWIAYRLIKWNMRIRKKIHYQGSSKSKGSEALRKALSGEMV